MIHTALPIFFEVVFSSQSSLSLSLSSLASASSGTVNLSARGAVPGRLTPLSSSGSHPKRTPKSWTEDEEENHEVSKKELSFWFGLWSVYIKQRH